jgi:hypothetical protein
VPVLLPPADPSHHRACILGGLAALAVTRRSRPAVTAAGVTLLCLSILLALAVVPKPPR